MPVSADMPGLTASGTRWRKVYSRLERVGRSLYTHVKTSAFNGADAVADAAGFQEKVLLRKV